MSIIKYFWWFFQLEKRRYLIGILALGLVSLLNLIPPLMMGQVIDRIAQKNLSQTQLLWSLALLLFSAFAMYGLRYVWRMYILATSYRFGNIMRSRLFEQFMKMSPSFYQKYRTGDLMAHATNDINSLTRLAGAGVMSFVDATVTALVTLVTMFFVISWQLTLVSVLPLPFMALATSFLGRKTHDNFKASQEAFSDLNNKVQEAVSGVRVTKSFGYQADEVESFQKINQKTYEKNMKTVRYDALFDPVVFLFVGTSYALTLLFGTFFIQKGTVSVGSLVTFMTYLDMLVWPLMAIGFLVNSTQRGLVSYGRIHSLLEEQSDVLEPKNPVENVQNGDLNYAIEKFAYEDRAVLEAIHFSLKKGQTLGLVGQTGSGKTSLIKLLLREYDVTKGKISLAGHNLKDYALKDLRQLMGYVPQDQMLFATSILDNVRFGNPKLPREQVETVTKLAQVYEDITRMPEGFDTVIGEKGVSLSGGQKQRLAISRALILNPEILILDDALSAVDAKTEHAIIENLKTNRKGKTNIIAAHRLSAVVHADLILVLQDGKIIERGRHEDLLAQKGWYQKTYQSQQLEMEESYV